MGADGLAGVDLTPDAVQGVAIPSHVQLAMERHRQRMVEAKRTLAETEMVLAEIAFAWSGINGMVLDMDNWRAIPPTDADGESIE